MIAFVKVGDVLIKAYDDGGDWYTVDSNNSKAWRSKWQNDIKGSLEVALNRHARDFGYTGYSIINMIEYTGAI